MVSRDTWLLVLGLAAILGLALIAGWANAQDTPLPSTKVTADPGGTKGALVHGFVRGTTSNANEVQADPVWVDSPAPSCPDGSPATEKMEWTKDQIARPSLLCDGREIEEVHIYRFVHPHKGAPKEWQSR